MRRGGLPFVLATLAIALAVGSARAQILSPGPLSSVHAELEGIRNCTQCHQLGRRGVDLERCLSCHTPLRERIRADRGLHARLDRECGSCHSDHNGRAFDGARFDERRFDHRETGFVLVGEHRSVTCRSCHTPDLVTDPAVRRAKGAAGRLEETFLGVASDCATCHRPDNPHRGELRTADCATCHSADGWDDTPRFDHAQTGTRLTGAHARAPCVSCHGAPGAADRFRPVPTTCSSCHAEASPHGRQFGARECASCHTTDEWDGAATFDHGRTPFPLAGAHVRVACSSCHRGGRSAVYAAAEAACLSCHADNSPHEDQFEGRECSACHGPSTWASAPAFAHDQTTFPLVGLHAAAPCVSCHPSDGGRQQFVGIDAETCRSCHEDAHDGSLGADCATCHSPTGWQRIDGDVADLAERFDHELHTGFALVGAHVAADCSACHGDGPAPDGFARRDDAFQIRLTGSPTEATFPTVDGRACLSCHVDAHEGELADLPGGADCASCHGQEAWVPGRFDRARHEAEAGFPLVGAHAVVPCGACHTRGDDGPPTFAVPSTCASCHAETSPHGDQFEDADGVTACADCHGTDAWSAAAFDHVARTGFALDGAHTRVDCVTCHERPDDPADTWAFIGLDAACTTCHAADDPHAGQFEGRGCDACHDTEAFTLDAFDHTRTAFPLEGAHQVLACVSCHQPEPGPDGAPVVRFSPLPTTCEGCHADREP